MSFKSGAKFLLSRLGFSRRRCAGRRISHSFRPSFEMLEPRLALSAMAVTDPADVVADVGHGGFETMVPMEIRGGQAGGVERLERTVAAAAFDIAAFTADPTTMTVNQRLDMGGLRLYSQGVRSDNTVTGTVTFGVAGAPTWTLIGLSPGAVGTYTPLLLLYGVTQMGYGPGLGNQITWSDGNGGSGAGTGVGMYTVRNLTNGTVVGGFQVSSGLGAFYASSLTQTGGPVEVASIVNGTVTTVSAPGFQNGQAIQFTGLQNTTDVFNATTYYVKGVSSDNPASFQIAESPNGSIVATANASGGKVAIDATLPLDVTNITNGVVTAGQPSGYLPGQQVQFQNLTGENGISNGTAYWVVPISDSSKANQFGISDTADGALLAASAGSATVTIAANLPLAVSDITNGLVTMPELIVNVGLFPGQAIRFSNLTGNSGVDSGTTYYVTLDGSETLSQFHLATSPTGPTITSANATGGQVSLDTSVAVHVESIVSGAVTTTYPTGYASGQAVKFSGLAGAVGFDSNATYFIQVDPTNPDAGFSISLTPGGPIVTGTNSGAGTVTQTLASTPPSAGALLPFPQAIPVATPYLTNSGTAAGLNFIPTHVLMASEGVGLEDKTPVLQFTGNQALGYNGSGFSFAVGGQGANQGAFLEVNSRGQLSFVDSGAGQRDIVLTASFGAPSSQPPRTWLSMDDAIMTTAQPHNLSAGRWIIVMSIGNNSYANGLQIGVPYRIASTPSPTTMLLDVPNPNLFAASQGGGYALASQVSIQGGVVTTTTPHGLKFGDTVQFSNLTNAADVATGVSYYVLSTPTDQTFTFGTQLDSSAAITTAKADGGQMSVSQFQLGGFKVGGSVSVQMQFATDTQPATLLIGGLASASYNNGEGVAISGTIALGSTQSSTYGLQFVWDENGQVTVPDWSFTINGTIAVNTGGSPTATRVFAGSIAGLTMQKTGNSDGSADIGVFGALNVAIPALNGQFVINLGLGKTDGLVIHEDAGGQTSLKSLDIQVELDKLKPATPSAIQGFKFQIYALDIVGQYQKDANDSTFFSIGGKVTFAVGSTQADANGNWANTPSLITVIVTPGAFVLDDGAFHFQLTDGAQIELVLNGRFGVGPLNFVANGVTLNIAKPVGQDPVAQLSGEIVLPDLKNVTLSLGAGNGGSGLTIDLSTGAWHLDGWRIIIPKLSLVSMNLENLSIGFTGGGSSTDPTNTKNWDLNISGTLRLMKYAKSPGMAITVHLDFGEVNGKFEIASIGAQVRGLNPGIAIGDTGGFATDLGLELDNLYSKDTAGGQFLLGATFGNQVSIGGKDYAFFQGTVQGTLIPASEFDLQGTFLFLGGIIGEVDANLDFNWGIGNYLIDLKGQFFDDTLEGELKVQVTPQDMVSLASVTFKVPKVVPLLGGKTLATAEAYLYETSDTDYDSFVAAWGTLFGKWTAGIKHDITTGATSVIGAKSVGSILANIPSDLQNQPFVYSIGFQPTSPTTAAVATGLADDDFSTDHEGVFRVVWDGIDPTTKIFLNAGGSSVQVWGDGVDITQPIIDTDNNLEYLIEPSSGNGEVLIHVEAIGADPYSALLPNQQIVVSLVSSQSKSNDMTAQWVAAFTAPPPQMQNLAATQPQGNALGVTADNENPNLATISFDYRTTDLNSTQIDLYYDYDGLGYDGVRIATLRGSDLTPPSNSQPGAYTTQTFTWDISNLPVVPLYVYAVIHDDQHVPTKTNYAVDPTNTENPAALGAVLPHPPIDVQIDLDGGGSTSDLKDWSVAVIPVLNAPLQSIANGVVTTAGAISLTIGQEIRFSGVVSPDNLVNDRPYYVANVNTLNNTFTFAAEPGAPAIFDASGTGGTVFAADPSGQPLSGVTNSSGSATFNVPDPGWYRIDVGIKNAGFTLNDGSATLASNGDAVRYIQVLQTGDETNVAFEFARQTAITGRIYNDVAADAARSASDPGAPGTVVFLDDNNNDILDPNEASTTTAADGTYAFFPSLTSNYSTTIRQIAPTGWSVVSPASIAVTNLVPGALSAGNDFLDVQVVTLGGTVYNDVNNNGKKDPGEPGVPYVTITISGPSNGIATTGADGTWAYSSTARGTYAISATAPNGAILSSPHSVTPQFGAFQAASFAISSPPVSDGYPVASAIASHWNASNSSYDVYAGLGWTMSGSQYTPTASVVKLNAASGSGSVLWSGSVGSATIYVSQIITGALSSDPGTIFAVVNDWMQAGFHVSATQLVRINSDGSTSSVTVTAGEVFAAWPHLGSGGGLVSVDPSGNVWSWSSDSNDTRTLVGHVSGTPVDITTFQPGPSKAATGTESIAVLTMVNGSGVVQVMNPDGTLELPINVGGVAGVSLVSGDFNSDGIEDLATLVADSPVLTDQILPTLASYTVTFLISDGDGDFSSATIQDSGRFFGLHYPWQPSPIRLAAVSLLGTDGDQVAWSLLKTPEDLNTIANIANVVGQAGGPFEIYRSEAEPQFQSAIQIHTLGDGTLVALQGSESGDAPYDIQGFSVPINPIVVDSYTATSAMTQYGGQFGGFNFGLSGSVTPATGQNLSGVVFNDVNNSGTQDMGEPGLGGYPVQVIPSPSVFTSQVLTGDGDSGVASSKTYTHALNFGGQDVVVNGVTFHAAQPSGTNYAIFSYDLPTGNLGDMQLLAGNSTNVTGNIAALMTDAFYSEQFGGEQLTLSGLTPGVTYTTTFYASGYGSVGQRVETIYDSQGGRVVFDENQFGNDGGVILRDTFTAIGTSITFTFIPQVMVHPIPSFHLYGLTNESVPASVGDSPAVAQTVVTGDGSDGRAAGAYNVPIGSAGYYVRTIAPAGANLDLDEQFNFIAKGLSDSLSMPPAGQNAVSLMADLQGNGVPTLVVLAGTALQVRLIKSDGTVYYESYNTGLSPMSSGTPSLAAVDLNGDGRLDLVASGNGGVSVLMSIGLGQFQAAETLLTTAFVGQDVLLTAAPGGTGGPGAIFAAIRGSTSVQTLQWDAGTAALVAGPSIASTAVQQLASGDVDADGAFDLVVYDGQTIHVYNGEAYGTDTVVGSFGDSVNDAALVVSSLRTNAGQSILLARRSGGAITLSALQADSTGTFHRQDVAAGSDSSSSPLWITTGDFADDNNQQIDVVVGGGASLRLFRNFGPVSAPLVLISAATQSGLPSSTQALLAVTLTPGAPSDLLSVDASGTLTAWQNLVHTHYVDSVWTRPVGLDIPAQLPGGSGGTIYGSIWLDADQSGQWSAADLGYGENITAYIDANNNGELDAGEPSATPSTNGQFVFQQVPPGTYTIRLVLGSNGDTDSFALSWPTANNGGITVTVPNTPLASVYGADFGLTVATLSSDFNADGYNDLLLTDPVDQKVYVQLHNGRARYVSRYVDTLPGQTWSVAGVADFNADGVPDILIQDSATGTLRVWQMRPGSDRARTAVEYDLPYTLPDGYQVVAVSDENGDNHPDLILRHGRTWDHKTILLGRDNNAREISLVVPPETTVVAAGDLNGDGTIDLLLRDSVAGRLTARLRRPDLSTLSEIDLGRAPSGWVVAGIVNLTHKSPAAEVLFVDATTLNTYLWEFGDRLSSAKAYEVAIGDHAGLRIHNAEPLAPTVAIRPVTPADRKTAVTSMTIVFSEPVTGFDLGDLVLTRNGGHNLLSRSQARLRTTDGGTTWVLDRLETLTKIAGIYQISLHPKDSAIANTQGQRLAIGTIAVFAVKRPLRIEASARVVTGTTVRLTAIDGATTPDTVFTWIVRKQPKGAPSPAFDVNNSANARSVVATFVRAGTYEFTVIATTGSQVSRATCKVTSFATQNTPPLLSGVEAAALAYTEDDPAKSITSSIAVNDVDNLTLAGATIQITGNYQIGQDALSFTNKATITGAWNATNGTLTLSGSDTLANYQAALRSVTYWNVTENPNQAVRTVSFKVSDGTAESNVLTRDITVTAVDDAPTVAVTTPNTPQSRDITIRYNLADAESDICQIAVQYSPDGGTSWNSATAGLGGDGTTRLSASPNGDSHTFVWASASDLQWTNNSGVKLRIQPQDSSWTGTAQSTQTFTVFNPRMVVELRVVSVPAASDRMSDAGFASYPSLSAAPDAYYVEIWLRDSAAVRGVVGGNVDLAYTAAAATATAIDHGSVFTSLPTGSIDVVQGLLDNVGGATFSNGEGNTQWVRLGTGTFRPSLTAEVTFTLGHDLSPGSGNSSFAEVGAGNVDWSQIQFGGTPVTVYQGNLVPATWCNPRHSCDVTGDDYIAPIDVLTLINDINTRGSRTLPAMVPPTSAPPPFLDPSGDGLLSPTDVLLVITYLNAHGSGTIPGTTAPAAGLGEGPWAGEGETGPASPFASLGAATQETAQPAIVSGGPVINDETSVIRLDVRGCAEPRGLSRGRTIVPTSDRVSLQHPENVQDGLQSEWCRRTKGKEIDLASWWSEMEDALSAIAPDV